MGKAIGSFNGSLLEWFNQCFIGFPYGENHWRNGLKVQRLNGSQTAPTLGNMYLNPFKLVVMYSSSL